MLEIVIYKNLSDSQIYVLVNIFLNGPNEFFFNSVFVGSAQLSSLPPYFFFIIFTHYCVPVINWCPM